MTPEAEHAVAAVRAGGVVVLPTDTVYGLAASGWEEEPARRLYAAKGRSEIQPTALLASSVDVLLDAVPELDAATATVARALLPGPYTLVVPNPARRFAWLTGATPDALGVRVPRLVGVAAEVLRAVGLLVATSANLPGGADPRSPVDMPAELRARVELVVDGGVLPGLPSTVVDLTGESPVVLREGAVPADEALAAIGDAHTRS